MSTGPASAASSRRASDHSAQLGSSVTRSSRTFVSTRSTSALAARHGHDLVCAQAFPGMAAKSREPVRPGLLLDLDQDDPTVLAAFEIDHAPRTDPQELANLLRDRDLTLARDGGGHRGL